MQQFYKEVVEYGIDVELCSIILKGNLKVTAVEVAATHVLAHLINPAFGDTYSFPWKRGPHDQIIEYQDLVPLVEHIRARVYKKLSSTDFIATLMQIFHHEQDPEVMTKVATLRIITQLLRIRKDNTNEPQVLAILNNMRLPQDVIAANNAFVQTLNQLLTSAKDYVVKSLAMFILH